jgi:hypothetical protein
LEAASGGESGGEKGGDAARRDGGGDDDTEAAIRAKLVAAGVDERVICAEKSAEKSRSVRNRRRR